MLSYFCLQEKISVKTSFETQNWSSHLKGSQKISVVKFEVFSRKNPQHSFLIFYVVILHVHSLEYNYNEILSGKFSWYFSIIFGFSQKKYRHLSFTFIQCLFFKCYLNGNVKMFKKTFHYTKTFSLKNPFFYVFN